MDVSVRIIDDDRDLAWWDPEVLAAANIMPATRLATDYLNVYNEAVMLLDLTPDMPDMLDELLAWQPLSYEDHFARSGFQAKELAILAYQNAVPELRLVFDDARHALNALMKTTISQLAARIEAGQEVNDFVSVASGEIKESILQLDQMVHGGYLNSAQDDIDALFE